MLAIGVVLVGGYFLMGTDVNPELLNNTQQVNQNADQQGNGANTTVPVSTDIVQVNQTYEVIYTDSGYAPAEITIKSGDTVTFKNQSSGGMWTASVMHPSHVVYGGTSLQEHCPDTTNTSFDECKNSQPGESWSFIFTKTGTWSYHNHAKASVFGKIIVE